MKLYLLIKIKFYCYTTYLVVYGITRCKIKLRNYKKNELNALGWTVSQKKLTHMRRKSKIPVSPTFIIYDIQFISFVSVHLAPFGIVQITDKLLVSSPLVLLIFHLILLPLITTVFSRFSIRINNNRDNVCTTYK